MELQRGSNMIIARAGEEANPFELEIEPKPPNPVSNHPVELDASAFLLSSAGTVRGDADMIFYGQKTTAEASIEYQEQSGGKKCFKLQLDRIPAAIDKVVFVLTLHEASQKGQSFSLYQHVKMILRSGAETLCMFDLEAAGMKETALILAEVYRRGEDWKIRAIGQGYYEGLAPLAQSMGVDIADKPAAKPPPAEKAGPRSSPTRTPSSAPVRLEKISLQKKGQSISLEKKGSGYGEIKINLNWNQQSAGPQQSGLLSRLRGQASSGAIDLDLACLWELKDGSKGIVQALGEAWGSLTAPPYIQLMGDDRTGSAQSGEIIRINGDMFDHIRRILVFAFIYEGVPNWQATDGVVSIEAPGQPELEVRLDSPAHNDTHCAIAMIDNVGGAFKVTRQCEYYSGHPQLDQAYQWGLRWKKGRK